MNFEKKPYVYLYYNNNNVSNIALYLFLKKIKNYEFDIYQLIYNILVNLKFDFINDDDFRYKRFSNKTIKFIEIPKNIKIINHSYFLYSSLENISLPKLNYIKERAFSFSKIVEITIPNTIKKLANSVFEGCINLRTVIFEDNGELKTIPSYTFCGCRKLTVLKLPNTITIIAGSSFDYCSSLSNLVIPKSVKNIYDANFECCYNLKEVYLYRTTNFNLKMMKSETNFVYLD